MQQYTRRFFMGQLLASVGAPMLASAAGKLVTGDVRFRLGVLSDIHVGRYGNGRWEGSKAAFVKALTHYRDHGADAVLVAGDMADLSLSEELDAVAECWYKVFPDDKAPDGRHVEKLFIYGNHDLSGHGVKLFYKDKPQDVVDAHNVSKDPAGHWKRCFHEDFDGVYVKDVKGYGFVGAHWGRHANRKAIEEAVRKAATISGPNRPFFYFQHPHLKGTCHGDWVWGHDGGVSASVLSAYPNAIAFSGHSHTPLTDERTIWQGAFTSIGTASLSYLSLDFRFRDNADPGCTPTHLTPRVNVWDSEQGQFLVFRDNSIVISRLDFMADKPLGEDWVLPFGREAEKPFDFKAHAARRTAPEFAAEAAKGIVVEEAAADADKKRPAAYVVKFPAAQTVNGCRCFEYEVGATVVGDGIEMRTAARRVLAKDFHRPPSQEPPAGECWFGRDVLPAKASVRFDVTPIDCFGIKGRSIVSDVMVLK